MSLTKKVTLLVSVVVLVCMVVLVWMSYQVTRQVAEEATSRQQILLAHKTLDQIDQFLYERYMDISVLSSSVQAAAIVAGSKDKLLSSNWIGQSLVTSGPWELISLVDNSGLTIESSNPKEVGEMISDDQANLAMFNLAKDGLIVHSDVVISEENYEPTIIFAAPVWQKGDEASIQVGVIVGHISWPVLLEMLPHSEAHAVLVNSQGRVVGQNHVFEKNNLVGQDLSETVPVKHMLESKIEHSHFTPSLSGNFESLTTHVRENGYLDYAGNGWAMIFEVPVENINRTANARVIDMLRVIVPVLVLGAATVVGLIFLYVVRPVLKLTAAGINLGKGDFSQRVEINTGDEVGALGLTFNKMAEQLGITRTELDQKVEEKTKALEIQVQNSLKQNQDLKNMNNILIGRELKMMEMKRKMADLEAKLARENESEKLINIQEMG